MLFNLKFKAAVTAVMFLVVAFVHNDTAADVIIMAWMIGLLAFNLNGVRWSDTVGKIGYGAAGFVDSALLLNQCSYWINMAIIAVIAIVVCAAIAVVRMIVRHDFRMAVITGLVVLLFFASGVL